MMNANAGYGLLILLTVSLSASVCAQPPGRGGFGRDRGGFGGDREAGGERRSGGMASRFDSNGDGRIDAAELKNLPEGFRNAMAARGVKPQAGLSVEDFGNNIRKQFEKRREEDERRMEAERRGQFENRSTPQTANRKEYVPPAPFRAREKERVTVDLPPKYSELDTDFDGQVGLYEWVTAKRDQLELFDEIDMNLDGMLTPRELHFYDDIVSTGEPRLASLQEKYQRPRVTIIGGPSATGSPGRARGKSLLKDEERERHQGFASKMAFPYIDANKDGRVTMEELKRDDKTRRAIGVFEKAGIRIDRPMSQQEFAAKWVEAHERFAEKKQKDGGDSGRRGHDRGRR